MSAATIAKAERLRAEGKVTEVENARLFKVYGDHDRYLVIVRDERVVSCDCPAHGECSHMYAVASELRAERDAGTDPFGRLGP